MSLDLIFPISILVILVVYFMFTRDKFEKDMLKLYDEKFEKWKKQNQNERVEASKKELIGLVYKDSEKLSIEVFDEKIKDSLKNAEFEIGVKK